MDEKKIQKKDVENVVSSEKNKKILAVSLVGLIALIVIIIAIIFIIGALGKPSKKVSEELIKDYLSAVNDDDGDEFVDLIDVKGYIIYQEEDAKKFDKKYKDKDNYLKKYIEENSYDDTSDVKDSIANTFKKKYSYNYNEYSFKEITSIEKSTKSSKIIIIKAKVKSKNKYSDSSDTASVKLSVLKVDGKYKIVGAELD